MQGKHAAGEDSPVEARRCGRGRTRGGGGEGEKEGAGREQGGGRKERMKFMLSDHIQTTILVLFDYYGRDSSWRRR